MAETTVFYLVLTFYGFLGSSNYLGAASLPAPYPTMEACASAARAAADNYNGGANVEWTCVPASLPTQDPSNG